MLEAILLIAFICAVWAVFGPRAVLGLFIFPLLLGTVVFAGYMFATNVYDTRHDRAVQRAIVKCPTCKWVPLDE